jgi:hypothetical protein
MRTEVKTSVSVLVSEVELKLSNIWPCNARNTQKELSDHGEIS